MVVGVQRVNVGLEPNADGSEVLLKSADGDR